MARRGLSVVLLLGVGVVLLLGAGFAIANHCGSGTHDFNGNCESGNQVSCAGPVNVTPGDTQSQVSVCSSSGPWQGRAYVYTNRPTDLDGGAGAGLDGDANNPQPLQGWTRVAWLPQLGYWITSGSPTAGEIRTECGAGDSWTEGGVRCGPQVQMFPETCAPGSANDFNGSCEDGAGHVHCGTGLLMRGVWGQVPPNIEAPWPHPGAAVYSNGAAQAGVCNDANFVWDGRVYVATYQGRTWAAADGDASDFGPSSGWVRVGVGPGGVECRRANSGDSFYDAGGGC